LIITTLNALAILLEAFFNIFLADTHTHKHTDMTAFLYPCCACARRVIHPTWSISTPNNAWHY